MKTVCGRTRNTHFIPSIISLCASPVLRQHCSELSWNVFHPISYSQQETVFSGSMHRSFTFRIDLRVPYVSWYRHSGDAEESNLLACFAPKFQDCSQSTTNKMQRFTIYLFISVGRSTCFRRCCRPSSGAQNCTYSVRYLSDRYCYLLLACPGQQQVAVTV